MSDIYTWSCFVEKGPEIEDAAIGSLFRTLGILIGKKHDANEVHLDAVLYRRPAAMPQGDNLEALLKRGGALLVHDLHDDRIPAHEPGDAMWLYTLKAVVKVAE